MAFALNRKKELTARPIGLGGLCREAGSSVRLPVTEYFREVMGKRPSF